MTKKCTKFSIPILDIFPDYFANNVDLNRDQLEQRLKKRVERWDELPKEDKDNLIDTIIQAKEAQLNSNKKKK